MVMIKKAAELLVMATSTLPCRTVVGVVVTTLMVLQVLPTPRDQIVNVELKS
jgi:hypothetical protein